MVCKVPRTSCCFLNVACHVKPLVLLFVFLQLTLLIVIVLHLRGVVDLLSPLDFSAPLPEKYKNYIIISDNEVFKLRDTNVEYFRTEKRVSCLVVGTKSWGFNKCECREHWHGNDCGIPDAIWYFQIRKQVLLKKRAKPRRLIYAFPVNQSIELVEIRIQELRDVVDVFIISERNHSSQEVTVLSQLSKGWLSDYADHLLYIRNPNKQQIDNDLLIHQIVHHLSDVRPDDFVIFTSFNEIPLEQILICLKLYDGFPEIFSLYFQQLLKGFYNILTSSDPFYQRVNFPPTVTTVHFLLRDCDGQSSCLRRKNSAYVVGSPEHPAGWKCNQCNNTVQVKYANELEQLSNSLIPKYVLAHRAKFYSLLYPVENVKNMSSYQTNVKFKIREENVTKISNGGV